MKTCLLVLTLAAFGHAQEKSKPIAPLKLEESVWATTAPSYKDAHDMAMKIFEENRKYDEQRGMKLGFPVDSYLVLKYEITSGSKNQGFSIDPQGNIKLVNITLEDAILALVASQLQESLDKRKQWDAAEEKRELDRKRSPPTKQRTGKQRYNSVQHQQVKPGPA